MNVFLSRDNPSALLQKKAAQFGWELICFSCIEIHVMAGAEPPDADWIFFYSPRGAELYAQKFTSRSFRFAALGEGTAAAMRGCELSPDFIGKSPITSEVMKEFAKVIKPTETVVQARGEKSFERLREQLNPAQILDWPLYRTIPKSEIPKATADYYIFTSPSNVDAYLAKYSLPNKATALAFGESTKTAIREKSNARILVTDEPGEESSIQKIERDIKR